MQTLGLSSESKRSDGWLKSLLWPSVENAWDVDYLGQQGMWICTLVAAASLFTLAVTGMPVMILAGLLAAAFYLLGGMGVREGSWMAASLVLAVYLLNVFFGIVMLRMPNIFTILFSVVLVSNLRATILASQWRPAAEDEDRPMRFSESLADKYIDQLPRKWWPRLQVVFLVLGVTMMLFSVAGLGWALAVRFKVLPLPKS
jgi:hypothetical protein